MAKAKLKTEKTEASVEDFLHAILPEQKQLDCESILQMMRKATGDEPKMWGGAIVGFGNVSLKYESGRELDWFKFGFSPRKQNIAIYGLLNSTVKEEILDKLGKHTTGKGCLYINNLKDINLKVFQQIIDLACKRKS